MRVPNRAFLCCACLLNSCPASAEKPKADPAPLTARIEVEGHDHSFTVRFFLKNSGAHDLDVIYGRGGSGMSVVPQFKVAGMTVTPPTYLRPPRRSMTPMRKPVPAGKEILYGTFTMGYPPVERKKDRNEEMSAVIHFAELKATVRSDNQKLKIPALRDRE